VTPYYQDDWLTVYHGDCKTVMAEMEPESVHCVVTSPPYWGLRDYGSPGQLGLERTPEEYVANMVAVFREVRRVLRADGTVWLNLGDSYASGEVGRVDGYNPTRANGSTSHKSFGERKDRRITQRTGLKPKDLVGIPWRVAFALQADGWYLRSDIIWSKPNPMPESVTDRPTKSHEYLFLLSKSARYYFDADAVREDHAYDWTTNGASDHRKHAERRGRPDEAQGGILKIGGRDRQFVNPPNPAGRNIRSVWTIATAPYPGAHFATFPPKLVEPCIKAGTSEKGVCPECGAPWEREVLAAPNPSKWANDPDGARGFPKASDGHNVQSSKSMHRNGSDVQGPRPITTGWRPTCSCTVAWNDPTGDWGQEDLPRPIPVPATILDPFAGSGTTGMVAQSLSRRAVLIDLSLDYLGQLMDRNADIPLGLGA
jgi:DNA modification methylase